MYSLLFSIWYRLRLINEIFLCYRECLWVLYLIILVWKVLKILERRWLCFPIFYRSLLIRRSRVRRKKLIEINWKVVLLINWQHVFQRMRWYLSMRWYVISKRKTPIWRFYLGSKMGRRLRTRRSKFLSLVWLRLHSV
jgi:hypothetical protein